MKPELKKLLVLNLPYLLFVYLFAKCGLPTINVGDFVGNHVGDIKGGKKRFGGATLISGNA